MKKNRIEMVFAGILTIGSLFAYFFLVPNYVEEVGVMGISPALFPKMTIIIIGFSSLIIFFKNLFNKSSDLFPLNLKELGTVIIFLFVLLFYVFAINFLGYYFSTFAITIILTYILGYRNFAKKIFITSILCVLLFFFFEKGLRVGMPRGLIF